jgi:hypothetical protein
VQDLHRLQLRDAHRDYTGLSLEESYG